MMSEKITPDTRAKIVKLRKEGKSFTQIETELKVKRGSLSHISSRAWFVAAMKEKGEDGKTGHRLFSEARKAKRKPHTKIKTGAKKEKQKKAVVEPEGPKASSKEVIDKEVESHLEGSDKDLRPSKKTKKPEGGAGDGDKTKKEKGKKGKGGLLIVLIVVAAAILIIALFMVFGRKEKGKEPGEESGEEGETKKKFTGRPFENL